MKRQDDAPIHVSGPKDIYEGCGCALIILAAGAFFSFDHVLDVIKAVFSK